MIQVSVVTPSYNQGRFVQRTIDSVLGQGYPHLEYVICDGASRDETATILPRYVGHARVISEPDSGQADAVNKGIRATSGEIIGWLNSDDTYCPGALMTIAGFFARRPDVEVVYGDANLIDVDDHVIGRYYTEPWNPARLVERPYICQPAVFFRRDVVRRLGPLDQTLHYTMDYEYWLRLSRAGASFAYLPYTLANARMHPESKTETHGFKQFEELEVVLKRHVKSVPDRWILTETQAIVREQRQSLHNPFDVARMVTRVSWQRSMQVNGSVSSWLMLSSMRTLAAGAVKSAMGLPVVLPNE